MKTMAEKIEGLLEEKGMSQKELADKAGVTEAAVSKYITLGRIPRADILGKIAAVLGVTADYLLGNSELPRNASENDIEKVVRQTIDLFDSHQDFYLCGMPLDDDDINLLRRAMLNGVEYAKATIQKKNEK